MSIISQATSLKGTLVWMGTCEEETCQDFDLTPYTKGESQEGIINFIFQIASNTIGEMWKGSQPAMFNSLNGTDDSNTLYCGKCYFIQLNPAVDPSNPAELNIPGANFTFADSPISGKLLNHLSNKPIYLPDLSNAASVISTNPDVEILKDRRLPARQSASTETATSSGVIIKPNGEQVIFNVGDVLNIEAGDRLIDNKASSDDLSSDGTKINNLYK